MNDKTLAVNTPAALAVMMRQAQSDPEFRDKLFERRAIPFGSLASALEAHIWRPIATAPKDGTDVMVGWRHIDSWFVTNAFWMDGEGVEPDDVGWWSYMLSEVSRTKLDGCAEPTHWMPLPPAPADVPLPPSAGQAKPSPGEE